MNITCNIIRDLLPLYAEDMVSEDSKKLVDDHLCGCDSCMKELGDLKKNRIIPLDADTNSLNRVGNTIRRRRILAVLTTFFFVVTLVLGGALLMDARIYLPADMAVESVEALPDGRVRMGMSNYVLGTMSCGSGRLDTDEPTGNYGIIMYTNLQKLLFAKERVSYTDLPNEFQAQVHRDDYGKHTWQLEGGASSQNFWYVDPYDGTGEVLLWDARNPYDGFSFVDVNYHIAWYCILLLGISLTLFGLSRRISRHWLRELMVRGAILCLCLSLSTVIVTAGQFMELRGEFTEAVTDSTCVALPMLFAALFARQLYLLNRQDKAI